MTAVRSITTDSAGNFYAGGFHNIIKVSPGGTVLLEIGEAGSGDGQLNLAGGIVLDSSGNIYVADVNNDRVLKFNSAGVFQGWMGECTTGDDCDVGNSKSNGFDCTVATCNGPFSGSLNGQFDQPYGIAIDISGNFYVLDNNNDRVQKFNSAGVFQSEFGTSGSGDGEFDNAQGIEIDDSGNIYVADRGNTRIQKFNLAGVFQGWMGMCTSGDDCDDSNQRSNGFDCTAATCSGLASGSGDGQFSQPRDIAFNSTDYMFVLERSPSRVQIFDPSDVFQSTFNSAGTLSVPEGIAIDSSDNIHVANTNNHHVQKFDSDGVFQSKFGVGLGSGDGEFYEPSGIALDDSNNFYVTDSNGNHRVQKFNSDGVFQSEFGTFGSGDGELKNPHGIALDIANNIYVADFNNDRVQKFNSAGVFQGWMGMCTSGDDCDDSNQRSNGFDCTAATCSGLASGSGEGQFNQPYGIALDDSGNIYVTEVFNDRVQIFNAAGNFQDMVGGFGTNDGQFNNPRWITVNSTHIFVSDQGNGRVQIFDSSGVFKSTFNSAGSSAGPLTQPTGIALDDSGNIYVVDSVPLSIQVFNPSGVFQFDFGTGGWFKEQFFNIHGIAVDSSGDIYVADNGNDRVKKFALPPAPVILSAVWDDVDNVDAIISAGDTLTLTFDIATNAPSVSNQAEIDPIVNVAGLFGTTAIYSGAWSVGNTVLTITMGSIGTASSVIGGNVSPGVTSVTNAGGTSEVWANTVTSTGDFGMPTCLSPTPGLDYVISSSCTLFSTVSVDKNVLVQNNSVLTIPSGVTLDIDFSQFNLTVQSGSGVLIKSGGTVT